MLFARRFRSKLPNIRTNPERESIQQAREQERKEKARLKMYKGGKSNVRPQNIKEGETILLERKTTKANSPFDPQPFTAEAVHGTQIVGRRGEEKKVHDIQKWKRVELRPPQQFSWAQQVDMEYPDISLPVPYKAGTEGGLQGLQGEGAGQGQAHIRQESDQVDRFVSRERWSFSIVQI